MKKPIHHVALVTGASRMSGLGRAIALRLAEDGVDLIVTGRKRHKDQLPRHEREANWYGIGSLREEIEGLGRQCLSLEGDLTNPAFVVDLVDAGIERFGRVDILINNAGNAGGGGNTPILDMDEVNWFATIEINLHAVFRLTRRVGIEMRSAGTGGAIVNVSSIAGRRGLPNQGAYCASKFALVGFTQQCALEFAPHNIRVNCVAPGAHETDMMKATISRTASHIADTHEDVVTRLHSAIPMQRQGRPEELAAVVAFLAGEDSSYMTGQTVSVDGGAYLG
ncbi:MAG: SDR family NAD(P)-dependent oxidoreductase [Rhodospirillaceae bacterium]|nr:SDR family NAD(P)-dependent oxidoreductase [Rhodospirillaceae bacterium]